MSQLISTDSIHEKIFFIRGQKVMLDKDLASLYGIKPTRLREQVRRNLQRFPVDFMFQLTEKEIDFMVSQNAIPSRQHLGGFRPLVFTQEGVAMLSSVLNSEKAVQVNIAIMRAFVKLREVLATHKELADRLSELERRMDKKDQEIMTLFEAIRRLMAPPPKPPRRKIGFFL